MSGSGALAASSIGRRVGPGVEDAAGGQSWRGARKGRGWARRIHVAQATRRPGGRRETCTRKTIMADLSSAVGLAGHDATVVHRRLAMPFYPGLVRRDAIKLSRCVRRHEPRWEMLECR